MSLALDLAAYLNTNTGYTLNTNLFVGEEPVDSPDECLIVTSIPGSYDSESLMERRAIQVIAKAKSFIDAETASYAAYNLLTNKPGLTGLSGILYCESIYAPYPIDKDARDRYIFTFNLLISKLPS